jgi:hypothetical protein
MPPPPPRGGTKADDRTTRAAAFLAQALGLADAPADLAPELRRIRDDATMAVYTAELDSSAGPAAFLIYVYPVGGAVGRAAYDAALRTLHEAAERDAPGPRLLASASSGAEGFLLATTPATFRALSGQAGPAQLPAPDSGPVAGAEATARRAAAGELLRLLREADALAATWLAAVRAEEPDPGSGAGPTTPGPEEEIVFDDVEVELALFLLDEPGIQRLLRVVNLFLTAARQRAAQSPELPPSPPSPAGPPPLRRR